MTVLRLRGVGVAFASSSPILRDVTLHLTPGFYGVVGANGEGKSTLLRLLRGTLVPSEGSVHREPHDAEVVLCAQEVDALPPDVPLFAEATSGIARSLRGRLRLEPPELARWPTLSPGERKRWQVGAALAREPEVLLLDEPSNHLDAEGRRLLIDALARFRGIAALVSHDRALLDALATNILRIHAGTVTLHPGSYASAKASWERTRAASEEHHSRARAEVAKVKRRLDQARRNQEGAERDRSAGHRAKGIRDHDARSMGAKVVAGWAEARAGRSVQIERRALARAEEAVPTIARDKTVGGAVFASYDRATSANLFHLDAPTLSRDGEVILSDVRVTIGRDERVRVTGPNGAGKSTLLDALVASHHAGDVGAIVRGRVLYLPQELSVADVRRMTDQVRRLPEAERGRILAIFAALGSDPARLLHRASEDASRVSPGEARKLALALGLGLQVWALVMDEPENHLDLPTIERVESVLTEYPGCIILVSHDDAFARATTTRTLRVDHRTVR